MIDWKTTEDKTELEAYAKEIHSVDLDKRKSVKKLRREIEQLEVSNGMRKETQEQETAEKEIVYQDSDVSSGSVTLEPDEASGAVRVAVMHHIAFSIWYGQSVSLPRHERERRIKVALVDKGYSDILDKLELPE